MRMIKQTVVVIGLDRYPVTEDERVAILKTTSVKPKSKDDVRIAINRWADGQQPTRRIRYAPKQLIDSIN